MIRPNANQMPPLSEITKEQRWSTRIGDLLGQSFIVEEKDLQTLQKDKKRRCL